MCNVTLVVKSVYEENRQSNERKVADVRVEMSISNTK